MNKKIGLVALFVGAYCVLLGGLFWNLHFDGIGQVGVDYQIYDWVWGLLCAIVIVIGSVTACKKLIACFVGCFIALAGGVGGIFVLSYGLSHNYAPVMLIVGIVATIGGAVYTFLCELLEYRSILASIKENGGK